MDSVEAKPNIPNAQWVRLYLVPQSDHSPVPQSVVGLMIKETSDRYVLNPLLELAEDANFEPVYVPAGMNFIHKTYVWRCQVLEGEPKADQLAIEEEDEYQDGL